MIWYYASTTYVDRSKSSFVCCSRESSGTELRSRWSRENQTDRHGKRRKRQTVFFFRSFLFTNTIRENRNASRTEPMRHRLARVLWQCDWRKTFFLFFPESKRAVYDSRLLPAAVSSSPSSPPDHGYYNCDASARATIPRSTGFTFSSSTRLTHTLTRACHTYTHVLHTHTHTHVRKHTHTSTRANREICLYECNITCKYIILSCTNLNRCIRRGFPRMFYRGSRRNSRERRQKSKDNL